MWLHELGAEVRRRLFRPPRLQAAYRNSPYDEVEFLAVDVETTGLDPTSDAILSVGYVPVSGGAVRLADAGYHLVRPPRAIPEDTAVLHGLLEENLRTAPPLAEVLPTVIEAFRGRVGIAHHATLEIAFLTAACRTISGNDFRVPFVCTLALEKRALARRGKAVGAGDLRLASARSRYGLPRYRAHDALNDALGAAELFLAQAAQASGRKPATLGQLMA